MVVGLSAIEHPMAHSFDTGLGQTGCPTTNHTETHTSDAVQMEDDPLTAHILVGSVVLAAGLPVAGHQAIAPADAIRIPPHHRFAHCSGAKPVDPALFATYLPLVYTSFAADLPNVRSL